MPKILVTGAAGHLGAAFVDYLLDRPSTSTWEIETIGRRGLHGDRLELDRMDRMDRLRVSRWIHDLRAPLPPSFERAAEGTEYIVHMAGEVHGIRSLQAPEDFVHSNVLGTFHLLELARKIKPRAFFYV